MMLRMLVPTLAAAVLAATPARGQQVEVTPVAGLAFGGAFEVEDGELSLDAGRQLGVVVDVPVMERVQLEFRYLRQESGLVQQSDELFGAPSPVFDVTVHHLLGGILWEIGEGRVRPFAIFALGAAGFAPDPEGLVTEWRFAGGLGAGLKLFLSKHVGVRLEALALPALVDSGTERIFCTSPAGQCFVTVTGVSALYQGAVSGGLVLAF